MKNYSILTTCDKSYFPHLQILINSIIDKCDISKIKHVYIVDTGLTESQIVYLNKKISMLKIIDTGMQTNFDGGTWGKDWQLNVKGKTTHLYNLICKIQEPLLMLDADMMITKDLFSLLDRGGDLQVCVRPNNPVKYIGSYFFSINHEKTLQFVKDWKDLTLSSNGKKAHESPALTAIVKKYYNDINIIELNQNTVNRILYPPQDETIIVHFKGSSLHNSFESQFDNRITNREGGVWMQHVNKYIEEYV